MRNEDDDDVAAAWPLAAVCPPIRCYHAPLKNRHAICGAVARWRRPAVHWFDERFYCDAHRATTDVPIVGDAIVRRLVVECKLLLTGASMADPFARREGVKRLEGAVVGVGAVLEVQQVYSRIVRYGATPPPDWTTARAVRVG